VKTAHGEIIGVDSSGGLSPGHAVQVSIRPEAIHAGAPPQSNQRAWNQFEGQLELAVFAGAAVEAEIRCNGEMISCLLDYGQPRTPGQELTLHFASEDTLVLAQS
jgi:ABC-type Fe3+/spermidine/putrescine transport system ATPase subunit